MVEVIYDYLNQRGLNPYFVGQHEGLCEERFLIIKEGFQIPSISSSKVGQSQIDIIIFVPIESYIKLDVYKREIRSALRDLSYLRKTGLETESITDDEKKAYTMSIEYVLQKKLEG